MGVELRELYGSGAIRVLSILNKKTKENTI